MRIRWSALVGPSATIYFSQRQRAPWPFGPPTLWGLWGAVVTPLLGWGCMKSSELGLECTTQCTTSICASEVMTVWRYINSVIIVVIIKAACPSSALLAGKCTTVTEDACCASSCWVDESIKVDKFLHCANLLLIHSAERGHILFAAPSFSTNWPPALEILLQ